MQTLKSLVVTAVAGLVIASASLADAGLIVNLAYEGGADGTHVRVIDLTHLRVTSDATGSLTFGLYANITGYTQASTTGVLLLGGQLLSRNAFSTAPTSTDNSAWVVHGTTTGKVNTALFTDSVGSKSGTANLDSDGDLDKDTVNVSNSLGGTGGYFVASNGLSTVPMTTATPGLGIKLGTVTFVISSVNANALANAETIVDFWPANGTATAHGAYGEYANINTAASSWLIDNAPKGLTTRNSWVFSTNGVHITFGTASVPEPGTITLLISAALASMIWWRRRE